MLFCPNGWVFLTYSLIGPICFLESQTTAISLPKRFTTKRGRIHFSRGTASCLIFIPYYSQRISAYPDLIKSFPNSPHCAGYCLTKELRCTNAASYQHITSHLRSRKPGKPARNEQGFSGAVAERWRERRVMCQQRSASHARGRRSGEARTCEARPSGWRGWFMHGGRKGAPP